MLDLMIHHLFRQAAGKAAFYAATPSLRCGCSKLLGPVVITSDGWYLETDDVDSGELPDLIDADM